MANYSDYNTGVAVLTRGCSNHNRLLGFLHGPKSNSEVRFFSVFWIAYGIILLWLTPKTVSHANLVFSAMALFFAGGAGRLLSLVSVGAPEPLFMALMYIELAGPIISTSIFAVGFQAQSKL